MRSELLSVEKKRFLCAQKDNRHDDSDHKVDGVVEVGEGLPSSRASLCVCVM